MSVYHQSLSSYYPKGHFTNPSSDLREQFCFLVSKFVLISSRSQLDVCFFFNPEREFLNYLSIYIKQTFISSLNKHLF